MTLAELRAKATVPVEGGFHTWPLPHGRQSVTLEDGDYLYGLVRALQPTLVVESGTGLGVAAMFLATALKDNSHGELQSFEPDQPFAGEAAKLLEGLPATVTHGDFLDDLPSDREPDLVFIDSHAGRRPDDITYWLGGWYRGLVCIHDANRDYDLHGASGVLVPSSDGIWLGWPCA